MSTASVIFDANLTKTISKNRFIGLWQLIHGFQWEYIGATLSLGISALAKTATYMLLRYFVDHILSEPGNTSRLPWIALGFVGLALCEGGFAFVSGMLSARTAEGVTRRLRNFLYDHIQHLNFEYHANMQTGELIQRCTSDVDAVRRFFSDQAIGVGRIILIFVINFVAIMNISVKLALISIIVIPLVILTSIFFFRKVTKAYEAYQDQDAVLSTTLQENLSGVRVVKAFARQEFEMQKFEGENWEKFLRGKKLTLMQALFWPSSDILCSAQMLSGYLVGALMAINGEITVGTYMAYAGLLVWIIFPMRNLGRLIVHTSTGLVSYGRLAEIIHVEREPLDEGDIAPDDGIRGQLSFENVSFAYEGDKNTLNSITFSCQPGQVIALLGSTGSGKTTLVNLLPRFYDYTGGQILLDGLELNRYPRRFLRSQIGIVEQEPFLFSRTIQENISLGVNRKVSDDEVQAAARAAAIHDTILSFNDGYRTLVGERGVTLSGGQKQRVAIARTILKNPRILIMDDSTSAVDTETEVEIREALQNLMKNRTTFIIAHRIQSIMDADLILVMDKGKIVQKGKHEDLVGVDGIYRDIFNIQTRIEVELNKEIADVN